MLCCGGAFHSETSIMGTGSLFALDYRTGPLLTEQTLRAKQEGNYELCEENHNNFNDNNSTKEMRGIWKRSERLLS